MTSRYNPDDYDRILSYGGENVCEGCAFRKRYGFTRCMVADDIRFSCLLRDDRGSVDYIFVVKNAKAE